MKGHTAKVNAVSFLPTAIQGSQILLSGSSDGQICIWREASHLASHFLCKAVVEAHEASVNCIATLSGTTFFASGAADATVKIWKIEEEDPAIRITKVQQIDLNPKFYPLALGLHSLGHKTSHVLIVGGTKSFIQAFTSKSESCSDFALKATLSGHEGWIRSIDITWESDLTNSDLLIASASQDKYIRLWRIHQGTDLPSKLPDSDSTLADSISRSLSSKAHELDVAGYHYSLTFEALLLGHEDWVYSAKWNRKAGKLSLLSASADSSLAIWEAEASSGVWVSAIRLGEISVQKGSTTATGSTGGFWTGLWTNDGSSVACLGRTGSWRVWKYDESQDRWLPGSGVSGHVKEVNGLAWSKDGSYLLSTSSDQTTRLHAAWNRGKKRSWQEFARPQIHGYDLNCIDAVSSSQFISGADEKLLRVFDQPRTTAKLLRNLSGGSETVNSELPEVASIPVLGLSNKAAESTEDRKLNSTGEQAAYQAEVDVGGPDAIEPSQEHPPFEDELARHTLWPETEKLYGHGFEISAVAASHDGSTVATACKASSLDHAVIRLYETKSWHEVQPPLKAHSLTVTCLRYSDDDRYLLSTGRDRQWAIFVRDEVDLNTYRLHDSDLKGHSRMILGAAWAPLSSQLIFATAGRDKLVKLWRVEENNFRPKTAISASAPVTSVEFHPERRNSCMLLAAGTETGQVTLALVNDSASLVKLIDLGPELCPALAVNQLTWQPRKAPPSNGYYTERDERVSLLGVASEDCSVRILAIPDWS